MFDNRAIDEFKGVWVFCEQRQGVLQNTALELISEGRKLADELGTELCGLRRRSVATARTRCSFATPRCWASTPPTLTQR